MAPKKSPARKSASRNGTEQRRPLPSSSAKGSLRDRIIDAALREAAAGGWSAVSIDSVAARADIALGDVLLEAPTRAHIVMRFLDRVDERTLAQVKGVDTAGSVRDRLFDLLMRRFDVLDRDRDGVRAMVAGVMRDPRAAMRFACRADRSAAALLGAAGVSAEGLVGCARVQGLKMIMAYVLRAWMTDDTDDMAKTMAALDRALQRAERIVSASPLRRRKAAAI